MSFFTRLSTVCSNVASQPSSFFQHLSALVSFNRAPAVKDDELFTPVDYRVELTEIAVGQAPIHDDVDEDPDMQIYNSSYDV